MEYLVVHRQASLTGERRSAHQVTFSAKNSEIARARFRAIAEQCGDIRQMGAHFHRRVSVYEEGDNIVMLVNYSRDYGTLSSSNLAEAVDDSHQLDGLLSSGSAL